MRRSSEPTCPTSFLLGDRWWFHFALSGVLTALDDLFGQDWGWAHNGLRSIRAGRLWVQRHHYAVYQHARSAPLCSTLTKRRRGNRRGLPDRGPQSWSRKFDEWGRVARGGAGRSAHGWANAKPHLVNVSGPSGHSALPTDKWT